MIPFPAYIVLIIADLESRDPKWSLNGPQSPKNAPSRGGMAASQLVTRDELTF